MINEIIKLMDKKDYGGVMALLEKQQKVIAAMSPAFPYWIFDMSKDKNGKTVIGVKATSPSSHETHPLRGKLSIKMTPELRQFDSMKDALEHAYRTQTPLELDALSLNTWAGDIPLESLSVDNEETIKVTITPQPFPDPRPMKIYVADESTSIDFLMLGTSRIEGKDVIVLDNSKQADARIEFEIKMNISKKSATFDLKIKDEYLNDVATQYEYFKFLRDASGKQIGLKDLSTGKDLLISLDCTIDLQDIKERELEDHLIFLKNLIAIEKFFGVDFNVPARSTTQDEINDLDTLLHVIHGESVKGNFSSLSAVAYGKGQVKAIIDSFEKSNQGFSMVMEEYNSTIELFGQVFEFEVVTTEFRDVVIQDFESLKKRYELMQDEDSLKIVYVPASSERNKVFVTYKPKGTV